MRRNTAVADPDRPGADPIAAEAFSAAMTALGPSVAQEPLTIAVSGGPDSLALAILCCDWAKAETRQVRCLTVNHGLRPEAAEEAEQVASMLRGIGLSADVLHYDGPKPKRNIQATAREIRFTLISDWMQQRGLSTLLVAHHLEDQAETVLLRLGRGSGVDGLAAIAPVSRLAGMTVLRPLLGFSKQSLIATVQAAGLRPVDDPTNRDDSHARVRLRALSAALAREGMTTTRLAATARRMARARDALEAARDAFCRADVTAHPAGYIQFAASALRALPEEIALRVLSQAVRVLGGNAYPPREEKIEALYEAIATGLKGGRTCGGTRILARRDQILIGREAKAMAAPVAVQDGQIWDGRYRVHLSEKEGTYWSLGGLGEDGLTLARQHVPETLKDIPAAFRASLPTLRQGDAIVAIPHLRWVAEGRIFMGGVAFAGGIATWGAEFQALLPFSNRPAGPI